MKLQELLECHKPRYKEETVLIFSVENRDKAIEILNSTEKSKYSKCDVDRFYMIYNSIYVEIYL